jgi:hypothetical protein
MIKKVEFETELKGGSSLELPEEVASALAVGGRARVVVILDSDSEDDTWREAAIEQFLRDDTDEDAVYDKYL